MSYLKTFVKLTACCLILAFGVQAQTRTRRSTTQHQRRSQARPAVAKVSEASSEKYVPVHKYDPARDAARDVAEAAAEASRTNKRVLVEVGGEWCIWCHIMDDFFEKNRELLDLREKHFVMVKVNFSDENKNEQLLSRYPEIQGYPHLFVLDRDGKLLHSQDTAELEQGKSYNLAKFTAFLQKWAPPEK
ncbi:MAG TPA: thioredoxin family protein [Pyrinomonadaceae bacterium]|nr:thioredoxin family protein [Pyrinomonadaceae bacterium]